MAITDELRHDIEGAEQLYGRKCPCLTAMCDRIDAAHERELTMARGEAANKTLEVIGDGYIALPKDADGEYIHIGDVMVDRGFPDAKYTVVGIGKDEFFTRDAFGELYEHTPSLYIHYKQSTVEDVLHSFICDHEEGVRDEADLIAEYAAKLQLKED